MTVASSQEKEFSLIPIEFKFVDDHPLLDILKAPLNYWNGIAFFTCCR